MKILVFAGSNSSKSINFEFAKYASSFFSEAEKKIIDLSVLDIPMFGVDFEENNGIPEVAQNFASDISACDLIILSLAEHNGSYTAAFKSLYDWTSRIPNRKVWDGKPMLLLSTSTGERGGKGVLATALDRFPRAGAEIAGKFFLPSFNDNFHIVSKKLTNDSLLTEFQKIIDEAKTFVKN